MSVPRKGEMMRLQLTHSVLALLALTTAIPAAASTSKLTDALTQPATTLLKKAPSAGRFPNADTYWLRCEETVTLHHDGTVREDHHETARIFNERGLSNADVGIPYNTTSQNVTDIQARTIRPDGSVLWVQPSDIHETSPYSEFTLYDDAKSVAFSLPGVEDNAIIDYRYTILTRTPLKQGQFADSEWLAGGDPCRLNRYTLIAPIDMAVKVRTHNAMGVIFTQAVSRDGTQRIYQWEKRDSPEFTPEPDMPPQETYAPWVEVSTWPSWQSVSGWYQTLAGPRMAASPAVAALARRLTAGKTTERARAQAIFYWVEKQTRYVAIEMGASAYQPHSADAVCRNRYGDCKDMATLLAAMFHAAGIKTAWPALLDTEDKLPIHGHLAAPDLFDHAILRADLDGKPYWFDATAEFCAFGDIPSADRGLEALIVRGGVGHFETIPWGGPEANRTVFLKNVMLHSDGSADCRTTVHGDGDSALSARTELSALPPSQLRDHFTGLIGSIGSAAQPSHLRLTLDGCEDLGKPMTYGVQYSTPDWAIPSGPLLIVTDSFAFTSPASLRERHCPLFLDGSQETDYTASVQLPAGYTVESLPENIREETAAGTLTIAYAALPDRITIHKTVTLHPATIPATAYPALRDAFDRFARCLKQPIVLRTVAQRTESVTHASIAAAGRAPEVLAASRPE